MWTSLMENYILFFPVIRICFWVVVYNFYQVVRSWGCNHSIEDRVKAMMFKMTKSNKK